MGSAEEEDTMASKPQDFISINQKITLPENYKKFSTIKLRIKPAKLIFVSSGSDSNNDQQPFQYPPATQNEENKGDISRNELNNFRIDPSYLFSSAESLSVTKKENGNMSIPADCQMNQRAKRLQSGTQYQMTQTEMIMKEPEPNDDCEIVKELVLEKFKDLLQKFIEKSNSRRICPIDQGEHLRAWSDYETIHILDPFIFNLQQQVNQEFQRRENEKMLQNKEKLETENIREISYIHCNKKCDNENMTTEDEETTLESQEIRSDNHSRREYHPNYVHISEPMETVQALRYIEKKTETIDSQSIVSFPPEEDPNDITCNYSSDKLTEEINEQTCAIVQVLKILSMCERDKKLSESVLRVEAERVLLIASLRKQILSTQLTDPHCENEDDKNGFVLLSGLRIPVEQIHERKTKQTRFFICILRFGSTVFCSDLLMPNSHMELEVGEAFCFEELSTDFQISVEIYTMHLKIREKSSGVKILKVSYLKDNKKVKMFKKYRNFFLGLRSRFRNTTEPNQKEPSTTRKSAFTLIGRTVITRSKLQFREFSIENMNTNNFTLKELKCKIGSGVKLDIFLSGFLMVCESSCGKTRWRRQWCILDASELKFWDYPGREETTEPNRIIDLSRSLLPYIVLADRKFCSRPRSLHLKIGPDSAQEEFYHKDIFLAADNPRDFLFWEKELNRVLKNLINWGCMKTYFENSL